MCVYNAMGKKRTIDYLICGKKDKTWKQSLSNKLERLAQGNFVCVKGTDTIDFIP